MALVVITIQDDADGGVSVRLDNEPSIAVGRHHFSAAEQLGAAALNAIDAQLQPKGPQLVIAGADELPN